jgi:ABC-type hemin transport system ATPase subunit
VPRHQQEALAMLRQVADLAAVVLGFLHRVAIGAQQRDDLVEQPAAARGDPRHVLEDDQLDRVVLVRLQRQP